MRVKSRNVRRHRLFAVHWNSTGGEYTTPARQMALMLLRRALFLGCLFGAVESYTSTTTNVKKLDSHDHYDKNAAYQRYKGKERSTYGTKNKGECGWWMVREYESSTI